MGKKIIGATLIVLPIAGFVTAMVASIGWSNAGFVGAIVLVALTMSGMIACGLALISD